MPLRKGHGVVLHWGAAWSCLGVAAAQGTRHVANQGTARDRAGALCQAAQGRGMWLQGVQPRAGLGRGGGVRGRNAGLCRTGAVAWAGRGVAQGALRGAV